MPANLENSAVATGLEKVSSHSSPKEKEMQEGIAEERELKGKGARKRCTQLNAEFQRINSKEREESLLK